METVALTRRESRFAKRRRPSTLTIPAGVSPHVRLVFTEMRRQNVKYDDIEDRSGVLRATVKAWRHKNKPGLESIEAVLGCLGWDFTPIPRAKVLPKAVAADLALLAERHGLTELGAVQALIELVANVHERFPYRKPPRRRRAPQASPAPGKRRRRSPPAPSTAPSLAEAAAPL